MSTSKSILIVVTALCLASLVYAIDPAKPKPSNVFQASLFTMGSVGYSFNRGYYNGLHKMLRTDIFDQKGEKSVIYIGFYNLGKLYAINATSYECESTPTPPWSDPFAFLKDATYVGSKSLPDGKQCSAWKTDYGQGSKTTTCWRGNTLMMQIIEARHLNPIYVYTTDFEGYVDKGVFDLPKSCNVTHFTSNKRIFHDMDNVFPFNLHK